MAALMSNGSSSNTDQNHNHDRFVAINIDSEEQDRGRRSNESDLGRSQGEIKATWGSLFAFTQRKHTISMAIAILSSIGAGAPQPVAAIIYGRVFSNITQYGGGRLSGEQLIHHVSGWSIALAIVGAGAWVVQGASLCSWMVFGELQAKGARERVSDALLEKDVEWYDLRGEGIGSLLIRIQTFVFRLFGLKEC